MRPPRNIETSALERIERNRRQILFATQFARVGNPLAAEPEVDRLQRRLQAKNQLTLEEARAMVAGIAARGAARGDADALAGPERIWGQTIDFVGVVFLEQGRRAARAVARVATRGGQAIGTGFMVSDRLFMTNNHVLPSPEAAAQHALEFEYEVDETGRPRATTRFELAADAFFLTDHQDGLDYTLVAVGPRLSGPGKLADMGWCPLSDAGDKHALGEVANIVQHPDGRYKEVVLRENRLVSRLETVLHYDADTEPGSSGSPVFNNEWLVIALHHWGGPWRQRADDQGRPVPGQINEGIRASAIVAELRQRAAALPAGRRALLEAVIRLGERRDQPQPPASPGDGPARLEADGRVTWRIPLEISVRLPALDGAPAPAEAPPAVAPLAAPAAERRIDRSYENRRGYDPLFIPDQRIDLPALGAANRAQAARNLTADPGDDAHELRYQHFSLVMNRQRRLAFFTACNIDGRRAKNIDRVTGAISDREPGDGERRGESAEARETWYPDPRIDRDHGTNQALYDDQVVHGGNRLNRMFQRGHLVRRLDPVWGGERNARRAEADTFHFTNCTPQVGFFNGGQNLWRAVEDYVLDNAVEERARVCVFTGPVLRDDDPDWRHHVIPGFKVPLRFWKVVAWSQGGRLRATALIADQAPVLQALPEARADAEAFVDLDKVEDFLTTVADLEQLTGLDFGEALRAADIHGGGESKGKRPGGLRRVRSMAEIFAPPAGGADEARLGRLLVRDGALGEDDLKELLGMQASTSKGEKQKRLGELAVERKNVPQGTVDRALAQQRKLRGR